MKGRPGLLAVSLGSLVSAAAAAVAMPSNTNAPVVLLGTTEDEPLTGRIAAELRALGIAIEIRVVAGDERGIDLEVASALREGARAAVRVDAQAGRTEVSVADPITGSVALRQVLEGPPTAALASVLAVRTVEFVRATLLGTKNRGGASDKDGAEPGSAAREGSADGGTIAGGGGKSNGASGAGAPPMAGLSLALASGLLITPGGLDSQVTAGIVARIRLISRIGVELMGFTPMTSARAGDALQSTRTSTWLLGGGLFARQPLGARAGVELGCGVLAALLYSSGTVADSGGVLKGENTSGAGGSVYGRLGADLALTRALALRLDILGGGAFRQADNKIRNPDGVTVTTSPTWGRSFAAVLGGVEARWF